MSVQRLAGITIAVYFTVPLWLAAHVGLGCISCCAAVYCWAGKWQHARTSAPLLCRPSPHLPRRPALLQASLARALCAAIHTHHVSTHTPHTGAHALRGVVAMVVVAVMVAGHPVLHSVLCHGCCCCCCCCCCHCHLQQGTSRGAAALPGRPHALQAPVPSGVAPSLTLEALALLAMARRKQQRQSGHVRACVCVPLGA